MRRRFTSPIQVLALLIALATVPAAAADPPGGPRPLAKLPGPAGTAAAFSRDGKRLLTAGGDEARVWDAETSKPVTEPLRHKDGAKLFMAALSLDGKLVLTVAGNEAWIWAAAKGERVSVLRHEGKLRSASFSPDSAKVLTAGDDSFARVWEARVGTSLAALPHPGAVTYASFSPDGGRVLTVPGDVEETDGGFFRAFARLWDTGSGTLVRRFGVDDPGNVEAERWRRPAAISPDGKRVATIVFKVVYCFDAQAGGAVVRMPTWDRVGSTLSLQFSPRGEKLVTAGLDGVVVWDAGRSDTVLRELHITTATDAEFAPSGDRLLVRAETDECGVWDVASGRQVLALRPAHPEKFPPVVATG